jgi:hypothetical protein
VAKVNNIIEATIPSLIQCNAVFILSLLFIRFWLIVGLQVGDPRWYHKYRHSHFASVRHDVSFKGNMGTGAQNNPAKTPQKPHRPITEMFHPQIGPKGYSYRNAPLISIKKRPDFDAFVGGLSPPRKRGETEPSPVALRA